MTWRIFALRTNRMPHQHVCFVGATNLQQPTAINSLLQQRYPFRQQQPSQNQSTQMIRPILAHHYVYTLALLVPINNLMDDFLACTTPFPMNTLYRWPEHI